MHTTTRILRTFGARCLAAQDRRGTWRPAIAAAQQLCADTHAHPVHAARLVAAHERVIEHIKHRCLPPLSSSLLEGSGLGPSA